MSILEHLAFTNRIRVAVRALQAHRQAPARAGADGAFLAAVPGQGQLRRDLRGSSQHGLDVELEAHALAEVMRQVGDGADQRDVAAFVGLAQPLRQGSVREQGSPAEAQQATGAGSARGATQGQQQHERGERTGQQVPGVGQRGARLQDGGACDEAEDGAAHGGLLARHLSARLAVAPRRRRLPWSYGCSQRAASVCGHGASGCWRIRCPIAPGLRHRIARKGPSLCRRFRYPS